MTGWSRELGWLLGLCRHDLTGEPPRPDEHLDEDAVCALARSHRLCTVAERSWASLAEKGLAVPPPAGLRSRAAQVRRRSFLATAHLVRLSQAFERSNVTWTALKGPALSVQIHGDPTTRTGRDLDVIVPPGQVDAAVEAAARAGWTAPDRWRDVMAITGRYDLEMKATLPGQPLLEMHVALGPRFVQFGLDPFDPGARGHLRVGEASVPTLVGPARTVYVAWHGARGLWYRLCWLFDLAALLHREPDDAERVLSIAQRFGAEVGLRAGALVARDLFAVEPPRWAEASPRVARRVEAVKGWALERLAMGVDSPRAWSPPGTYRWLWREVAQQNHAWRAAAGALGQVARPTAEDARTLGLGMPLLVHRIARPYFLAKRLVRGERAGPGLAGL